MGWDDELVSSGHVGASVESGPATLPGGLAVPVGMSGLSPTVPGGASSVHILSGLVRDMCFPGRGGVKYRMLHIPGILDCTYHLHVSVSVCSRF